MPKCENCIHAEVCGLRDQLGEYAEQCEYFFKKIPKPHGRLIDVDTLEIFDGSKFDCADDIIMASDVWSAPTIVEAEVSE